MKKENRHIGIREFYKIHKVDPDFDEVFYAKKYPETAGFWKPFCEKFNIDDKHRLFFHWYMRSDQFAKHETYKFYSPYYKPPEVFLDRDISVVLGCMNRGKMLNISIHSWLPYNQIKEIIITDWSSDTPINYLEKIDPRIKVIRIEGKENYNASTPVNIAIKEAKNDIILKLDVDYIINPYGNFDDLIDIKEDEYICGNWKNWYEDNDLGFVRGMNGLLCVYKKHIETVGYYDESIENYGLEDCDMFKRLLEIGLNRRTLKFRKNNIPIYHNPHSAFYRTENFEQKDVNYNQIKFGDINLPQSE